MELERITDIHKLLEKLERDSLLPGYKVSLYVPLTHSSDYAIQGKAELKGLIQSAARKLTFAGASLEERLTLQYTLEATLTSQALWEHRACGIAIFASPDLLCFFVVPYEIASKAVAGEAHYFRPLLTLLSLPESFLVLELKLEDAHLMRVTPDRIVNFKLSVQGLAGFRAQFTPVASRDFHTASASHSKGNHNGVVPHGGHEDARHDEVSQYLQSLAKSVDHALAGEAVPLIVTGPDADVGRFLKYLDYARVITDDAILKNHHLDGRPATAWQQCFTLFERTRDPHELDTTLERYEALAGTDHIVEVSQEIASLARDGGVETLLLGTDSLLDSDSAMTDVAILATLKHHGNVIEATTQLQTSCAAIVRPGFEPLAHHLTELQSAPHSMTLG